MAEENKIFFQAISEGDTQRVKEMLSENSELVNAPSNARLAGRIYQPLAYAYKEDQLEICRILLQAGANVNVATFDDVTLLGEFVGTGVDERPRRTSIALDALRHDRTEFADLFAKQPGFSFEFDNKLGGYYDVFPQSVERHDNPIYQEIFARQMTEFYEKRVDNAETRLKHAERQKENMEERLEHFKECAEKKAGPVPQSNVAAPKKFKK